MGPNKAWKMNSGSFWTPWCHTAFALRYLWWDCLPYLNHVQLTQLVQSSINLIGSLPPVLFLSASLLSDAVMCIAGEFLHAESSWWDPILDIILSASVCSSPEVVFSSVPNEQVHVCTFEKSETLLIHVQVWRVNHLWTAEKMVLWTLNSEMSNFVDQFLLHSSLLFWGNSECTLFSHLEVNVIKTSKLIFLMRMTKMKKKQEKTTTTTTTWDCFWSRSHTIKQPHCHPGN